MYLSFDILFVFKLFTSHLSLIGKAIFIENHEEQCDTQANCF